MLDLPVGQSLPKVQRAYNAAVKNCSDKAIKRCAKWHYNDRRQKLGL